MDSVFKGFIFNLDRYNRALKGSGAKNKFRAFKYKGACKRSFNAMSRYIQIDYDTLRDFISMAELVNSEFDFSYMNTPLHANIDSYGISYQNSNAINDIRDTMLHTISIPYFVYDEKEGTHLFNIYLEVRFTDYNIKDPDSKNIACYYEIQYIDNSSNRITNSSNDNIHHYNESDSFLHTFNEFIDPIEINSGNNNFKNNIINLTSKIIKFAILSYISYLIRFVAI